MMLSTCTLLPRMNSSKKEATKETDPEYLKLPRIKHLRVRPHLYIFVLMGLKFLVFKTLHLASPPKLTCNTRMHSSRMRTGPSLTVCWSLLPGGCLLRGDVCSWGVWSRGGSGPGGCLVPGGVWSCGVCS